MKPLLICDCDEVLVHMVRHFRDWLGEAHDMDFALDRHDFFGAVTRRDGGPAPTQAEAWDLLHGFFLARWTARRWCRTPPRRWPRWRTRPISSS